jgi:membrane protein implicated in regulation of membrane protease activity
MTWWIWMLLGLGLLMFEIVIPGGIIMLFFGVSALVVGGLVAAGTGGPLWLQILLFAVLSVVSLLTLRGPILRRMKATQHAAGEVDSFIGANAELLDDIAPGAEGKAELRGTVWTAHNVGDRQLDRGKRCTVEKVEGLTLFVR